MTAEPMQGLLITVERGPSGFLAVEVVMVSVGAYPDSGCLAFCGLRQRRVPDNERSRSQERNLGHHRELHEGCAVSIRPAMRIYVGL